MLTLQRCAKKMRYKISERREETLRDTWSRIRCSWFFPFSHFFFGVQQTKRNPQVSQPLRSAKKNDTFCLKKNRKQIKLHKKVFSSLSKRITHVSCILFVTTQAVHVSVALSTYVTQDKLTRICGECSGKTATTTLRWQWLR